MKKHRLALKEGEEILKSAITFEPNAFAKYIDTEKVMLILARFDCVVPARHRSSAVFIPCIKS